MNQHLAGRAGLLAAAIAVSLLAGCSNYVKKTDYEAAIAELRAADQQLQNSITTQVNGLKAEMEQRFAQYDARLTVLEGRITVDNIAYFDFNQSALDDQYKPMLDEFAKVMRTHHPDAVVTVEGFADPSGSKTYNQRLAMKRAEAVRDYLVSQGGMVAEKVRAVSYGKDANRQIDAGATHEAGRHNRRATLVIDFAS
ncbi:MAG: OmpA family protein [Xanthomonadales bacterium]|nr:OmpA family protein [Xanthomonadales bacterium]